MGSNGRASSASTTANGATPPSFRERPRRTADGLLQIGFAAIPTRDYRVLASVDLVEWEVVDTITATADSVEWTDQRTAEFPLRFYRMSRVDAAPGVLGLAPRVSTVTEELDPAE